MNTGEEPVRIIGNESNMIHEIEPGSNTGSSKAPQNPNEEQHKEQSVENKESNSMQQINNDLATNDGAVTETLDTAFHNKPGVAEGTNPSGSNRAGYYEERSNGQSDATEESNSLSSKQP